MVTMTEPYIPGFLAFREVGFLINCLEELKSNNPLIMPQVPIFYNDNYIITYELNSKV